MAVNLTGGIGTTAQGVTAGAHTLVFDSGVSVAQPRLREDIARQAVLRPANGSTRAGTTLALAANALVQRLDVKITAARADLTLAAAVADVREGTGGNGQPAVIVDFGTMRTVSQVLVPGSTSASEAVAVAVKGWLGTKFDANGVTLPRSGAVSVSRGRLFLDLFTLPELRTERLLIEFDKAPSSNHLATLLGQIEVALPELPADLSLRIGDGPPLWEHAGTVEPGTSASLDAAGWTSAGERLVPIATALAAFSADATSTAVQDIDLQLQSRVPGRLALEVAQREELALHRVLFNGSADVALDFAQEGQTHLDIAVPHPGGSLRTLRGLRLTLAGAPGPERVLPPLGPEPSGEAELVLGNARAACVRLDGAVGITELTGVRLPLATNLAGAEARLVLWRDQAGVPFAPLSDAVSAPVVIEGESEQWYTFALPPTVFDAEAPPWAALVVSRGEVRWGLAVGGSGERPLRLGSPAGPWRAPPAIFAVANALGSAVGRLRCIGQASETEPLAPYLLSIGDDVSNFPVTPSAAGLRLEFSNLNQALGPASNAALRLSITSRSTGVLNISEVDAVTEV